jgi:galactokinase
MTSPIDSARRLFDDRFGGDPTGVWAAPGRVNLIGEHTDYNNGLVLPIALPQATYAAVRLREDGLLRLASAGIEDTAEVPVDEIAPGTPGTWARYPAGVLWAFRQAGHQPPGLDIAFASDVPIGAGLSSSAAIEASVAAALSDLLGLDLLGDDAGRSTLAAWCQRAENDIALAPTGGMDVPFDLKSSGQVLLVIDTRAEHALSDGQYAARRAEGEQACRELALPSLRALPISGLGIAEATLSTPVLAKRVRHVVTEIDRVRRAKRALATDDLATLGSLFNASHDSLRDDFEVSCAELDLAQETALAHGALGARMTGGGFGGSAIAIVAESALPATRAAIGDAFAAAGFLAPAFLEAMPAGPARSVSIER